MPHNYIKASAHGFGKWDQCKECGTTKHSGYYWLAGYKSEVEPPCSLGDRIAFKQWANNAVIDESLEDL